MFYALRQRLQLLLKVYIKQLSQQQEKENVSNYSKVIETVILKMVELEPQNNMLKQLLTYLLAVALYSQFLLKTEDHKPSHIESVIRVI